MKDREERRGVRLTKGLVHASANPPPVHARQGSPDPGFVLRESPSGVSVGDLAIPFERKLTKDFRRAALAVLTGIGAVALILVTLQVLGAGEQPAHARRSISGRSAWMGYEPSIAAGSPGRAGSGGWQEVFSETFEGGIASDWLVADTSAADEGTYLWGTSTFTYAGGVNSAWCAGGGDGGWDQLGGFYTDSMDAWLVSPPIVLGGPDANVWDAEVQFAWWLDASFGAEGRGRVLGTQAVQRISSPPPSGDWFGWGVLTDVTSLESGQEPPRQWTYVSGSTAGWAEGALPLDAFLPRDEELTSTVRIAFRFVSDDDGAVGRGAFVDDVVLRLNYGHKVALPFVLREAGPTPSPTPTATPTPTSTPTPTPTPTSTPSSILQNGSFEGSWYDVGNRQVPDGWELQWVDGETLPGSDQPALSPEMRVLSPNELPPHEWDLFILDGEQCVKIFKESAPIYTALSQDVSGLEVGRRYRFTVPIYVDVYDWVEGEGKVPPPDPWAAQLRLGVAPWGAEWRDDSAISYGQWWNGDVIDIDDFYLSYNYIVYEFTASESEMTVYVELFAKWGMENNGFFMDDLKLVPLP